MWPWVHFGYTCHLRVAAAWLFSEFLMSVVLSAAGVVLESNSSELFLQK